MDQPSSAFLEQLAAQASALPIPIIADDQSASTDCRDLAVVSIVTFPDYSAANPYQNGLYSAFRSDGSTIEFGPIERALERITGGKGRPTIFHLHWPDPLFATAADGFDYQLLASDFLKSIEVFKAFGGVFVWTIHNRLPHEPRFGAVEIEFHQRLADTANVIHLHDRSAIAAIQSCYRIDERKCLFLAHGSYEGCYAPALDPVQARKLLGLGDASALILLFGQIRPYKGLEELIRAYHHLVASSGRRDVHLLIAGKAMAGFTSAQARLIEESDPHIHVLDNFAPDAKIPILFGAADIVVLPYREILSSGTLMLAATYGKPVVAPRLPALSLVEDAGLGIAYDPEDADALADGLSDALNLGERDRAVIAQAGQRIAKSLAWPGVSADFRDRLLDRIAPAAVTIQMGRTVRSVRHLRKPGDCGQIGVAVVNNRQFKQVESLLTIIPAEIGGKSVGTYLFDDSSGGVPNYNFANLADNLLYADRELGPAAATNILLETMRQDGCTHALILDARAVVDPVSLGKLLCSMDDDSLIAPMIADGKGRILCGGYRSFYDHGGCLEVEPLLAGEEAGVERDSYTVHALDPRALCLPLAALDRIGFIPEEYGAADAVLDWTLMARRKGLHLRIVSDATAHWEPLRTPGHFPNLNDLYYRIRNQFLFARKMARKKMPTTDEQIIDRLTRTYIAPLRKSIGRNIGELLPLFERCVAAALEDGKAGLKGRIALSARLDDVALRGLGRSKGHVDGLDGDAISGWLVERPNGDSSAWSPGAAWLFQNGAPRSRILPTIDRRDVASKGFCSGAGFTLRVPVNPNDRADFEIRANVDGRSVPMADPRPAGVVHPAPAQPRLKAVLDTVEDGRLKGWALDLAHSDVKFALDIIIDNELVATGVRADLYRKELDRGDIGDGRHAFELPLENMYLLQDSVQVELRLTDGGRFLVKKNVAIRNEKNGFSPYFSLAAFLRWSYCEDRMGIGHSEQATGLLGQLAMEKRLLERAADRRGALGKVTVIMPAFNRAGVIGAAIRSVLGQSHGDFQLIVVDDGSSDETATVVRSFDDPRISLIETGTNMGVSGARNRALEAAEGEIIAYLDTDNLWDRNYLKIMVAALADNPGHHCAYAGQILYRSVPLRDGTTREEQQAIRLCPFNRSRLEQGNFIDLNVFVHRRSLYGTQGGFDETLTRLVDWDLILRYTRDGPPLMVQALLGVYFWGRADNQISRIEDFDGNRRRVRLPTPASAILTAMAEPGRLDIMLRARSLEDARQWGAANRRLLRSSEGGGLAVWDGPDGVEYAHFANGDDVATLAAMGADSFARACEAAHLFDEGRDLLIVGSDYVIRPDCARTLAALKQDGTFAAITGRSYARSGSSKFGRSYVDMTPRAIRNHVRVWTQGAARNVQIADVVPREYLYIPAQNREILSASVAVSRDFDEILDRYFACPSLPDARSAYAPDLMACHRDDLFLWT